MPDQAEAIRRPASRWRLLAKELTAFGVVGGATFVLDLGSFQLLYAQLGVGAVTARLLSTLLATTTAYLAHRYWSFSHRARTGLRREYALFAAVNGVTLALSLAVVWFVRYPLHQHAPLVLQLANVGSIVLGSAIRYLSYRRWVFLAPDHPATVHPATVHPATVPPIDAPAPREPAAVDRAA